MDALNTDYQKLIKEKEAIEAKIKDCNEILSQNCNVGMQDSLVDAQGYPRSDIDVYSVRHARHNIICLQNDHKMLMQRIEEKLYEIHDWAKKNKQTTVGTEFLSDDTNRKLTPFLVVNQVVDGGPAQQAGIKMGDLVKMFGSVSINNFRDLQDIGLVVVHSKDKVVKVVIERNGMEYRLELTPRVWSGKGLLGCNVTELKQK